MTTETVKGAPGVYEIGENVLQKLNAYLTDLHIDKFHIVSGRKAWNAAFPYLPTEVKDVAKSKITVIDGPCTLNTVDKIVDQLTNEGTDAVIGIGGGTALDITKASAAKANTKSILIPTIAATCAAWTPLSVFYDDNGTFTHWTQFPVSNTLVLIEPAIVANAPVIYLKAGIGDTIAKYYEANALVKAMYESENLPVSVQISQVSAAICRDILLKDATKALSSASNGVLSDELIRVIEAIIQTGGMVGGFGNKAGRSAGAHAVHNGLTEAKEVKKFQHGEIVAYGVLVQLALEGNIEEVIKLKNYYQEWDLPATLKDLNIQIDDNALLRKIIQKAILPHESIHFMKQEINEVKLLTSMKKVEELDFSTINK